MTLFDLLFILVVLMSMVMLAVIAAQAVRGRRASALKLLRVFGVSAAAYVTASFAVALVAPQRVLAVGDPWCFDDWCLTVERVTPNPSAGYVSYQLDLRIFSRARRVAQRARGAWAFLIDDHGRRYAPELNAADVPLDVLLQPGESVAARRVFHVPSGVRAAGFITGHGGPYCGPMDILVIGASGCVFGKPTMVQIQ